MLGRRQYRLHVLQAAHAKFPVNKLNGLDGKSNDEGAGIIWMNPERGDATRDCNGMIWRLSCKQATSF